MIMATPKETLKAKSRELPTAMLEKAWVESLKDRKAQTLYWFLPAKERVH